LLFALTSLAARRYSRPSHPAFRVRDDRDTDKKWPLCS